MNMKYNNLYKKINYLFTDESILEEAFTHRSKGKKNYERLEFLGDSVLGFVIAEEIFNKCQGKKEGYLSLLRTKLVKGTMLTRFAKNLKLDQYVIYGKSESSSSRSRDRILEDVFEAMIGAIYLDSDFSKVKECILNLYKNILDNLDNFAIQMKDSKSSLQEIVAQNGYDLPNYSIVGEKGKDHQKSFVIGLDIPELKVQTEASANTIRKGQQECARLALIKLKQLGFYEKKKK